eukprot:CAMPEP_0116101242 /NCGR_PEP_ID=MMETSP0327-20121206/12708_1 /TAXON_ID=44447 /ORGANISM="Pseudo-nitzschia delicatissima, Strain B596" /LENGTH=978 /DNA_ID=CAMNT_0003593195 /DNA_START=169 /DNA_END=3105 /DNA_ORIENTATION=+
MGSLSEDELEAMQGKARKLTMMDLKKRALAAKQGGDLETAMGCLKQAKKLEAEDSKGDDEDNEDEPPYSSTLPLFWKKVAILCKQAGDIDRAKQALVYSKELEVAETETKQAEPTTSPVEEIIDSESKPSGDTPNQNSNHEKNVANTGGNQVLPPPVYDDIVDLTPPPPPAYDNLLQNCQVEGVDNEEEAAMLAELMGGGERKDLPVRNGGNAAGRKSRTPQIANIESPDETDADITSNESILSTDSRNNDDIDAVVAPSTMTFTDEELMDEEMMLEFAADGVNGIPTQEQYASKVLTYKKLALKFKQEGNIPKATQNLRFAKQLEKVAISLKTEGERSMNTRDDSWLETLDTEESELLGELLAPSQKTGGGDLFGAVATTDKLTLEDLEEMDDDNDVMELVEMMGTNALPSVEEVTAKITKEKENALKHKQEGNIELAKSSLLKSKKSKLLAMRLAEIYRKLEAKKSKANDENDAFGSEENVPVSMEALEALVDGGKSNGVMEATVPPPKKPEPPKDPWLLKPSIEIKAQVIRLKNKKQVKEATRLLQLFKKKLAQEQEEAERQKVAKMTSTIQKRLEVCTTQRQLWQYYQWFGKERAVGTNQYQEWTAYEKECQKAIYYLETQGSTSVIMAPRVSKVAAGTDSGGNPDSSKKLYLLEEDITSLVESCTNETTFAADKDAASDRFPSFLEENALEVAILGLFGLEKNEKLQKILSKKTKSEKAISATCPDVRIQAKLQLPIQPEDPSKPLLFDLEPSDLAISKQSLFSAQTTATKAAFRYGFDPSSDCTRKQVSLPRKDPKHERILLRRMETKTLQLSVFCLHNQNKRKEAAAAALASAASKKSWFFGRSEAKKSESDVDSNESESKDLFLGKVTIELKPLLSRGCLAGDYPILVNSKSIGGVLRVCLRTRPVLDPDRYEGLPWKPSDGAPVSLSISTYKKGLSFTFPNETISQENQSIESIKRESVSSSAATQSAK